MQESRMIRRIGIVSGVADELAAVLPGAPSDFVQIGQLCVRRTVYENKDIFLACAGIGKVAAATAASVLCAHFEVDLLVVVGTAAKIADIEGDIFLLTEAVQGDFGAQRPLGLVHYTAGTWPIGLAHVKAFTAMALAEAELPSARVATSDLFIECTTHADGLREKLNAELIDMETAAVAQTAALLGVPWIAIKATTDSADGESADAFVANLKAAAAASARAAERIIQSLLRDEQKG